jgi:hypothetical protein
LERKRQETSVSPTPAAPASAAKPAPPPAAAAAPAAAPAPAAPKVPASISRSCASALFWHYCCPGSLPKTPEAVPPALITPLECRPCSLCRLSRRRRLSRLPCLLLQRRFVP